MHPGNLRKPFNPAGPFVARRRVLVAGTWYNVNEWLPHEGVPVRRLRQLFDGRKIDVGSQEDVDLATSVVKKEELKKKIEVPANWRQLTNKELFPLVRRLVGALPKNRMEAYAMMKEIEADE